MAPLVPDSERLRSQMVASQLAARDIQDPRVLAAFRAVPREAFVPDAYADGAYSDQPLPLGHGQTISQPYVVALMADALALRPDDRALEIGTGSGYATAILSRLAKQVFTVERLAPFAAAAATCLRELGYDNVEVRHADGTLGWEEHAPYDAIAVTAGGPTIPEALLRQLAVGGRLVIPVGATREQRLMRVTRTGAHDFEESDLGAVSFVPLIGAGGWPASEPE